MKQVFKRTLSRSLRLHHIIIAAIIGVLCATIVINNNSYALMNLSTSFDRILNELYVTQHIAMFIGINGIWLVGYIANVFSSLVAEEVHEGTLRMLLAKPNSRNSVLLGKVLGGFTAMILLMLFVLSAYGLVITLRIPDGKLIKALLHYLPFYLLYGIIIGVFFGSFGLLMSCIFKRALVGQFAVLILMIAAILAVPFVRLFNDLAASGTPANPYTNLIDVNYHLSTIFRWCVELGGKIKGTRSNLTMLSYFTKMFVKADVDPDLIEGGTYMRSTVIPANFIPAGYILAAYGILTAVNFLLSFRLFRRKNV